MRLESYLRFFAHGCTSPDNRFQDLHPGTVAGNAAMETKEVRRIAILKIPETNGCHWRRSSENLPSGRHRRYLRDFRPLSIETVQPKGDTSGSEEEIRSTRNARPGSCKLSASPSTLSFHSVSRGPPECRSRSTAAYGRELRKSTHLPAGASPTTSSDNPNPAHSAPALQRRRSDRTALRLRRSSGIETQRLVTEELRLADVRQSALGSSRDKYREIPI